MKVFEGPTIMIRTFTVEDILTAGKPAEPTLPSNTTPEDPF
ncbi:MAG: hypothetical protein ACI3VX_00990 [Faecousia sp.]